MPSMKELQEEKQRLVLTILRLEQDLGNGTVERADYLKERRDAEGKLIAIMEQLVLQETF